MKCVYCEDTDHNLPIVKRSSVLLKGKKILMEKKNNIEHQIVEAKEHVELATKDIILQYVASLTQVFLQCLQQIKEM